MDHENGKIEEIIEKLSTNGNETLDPTLTKQLKVYCKSLNDIAQQELGYNRIGRLILYQLQRNHAQIRYSALLIVEYLFERAHRFRLFMCNHLDDFFKLCLDIKGFNRVNIDVSDHLDDVEPRNKKQRKQKSEPLRPIVWATKLREKALQCFSYWYTEFGNAYQALKIGHTFLTKNGAIMQRTSNVITMPQQAPLHNE